MFVIECLNCGYEIVKEDRKRKSEGGISITNLNNSKDIEIKCENCGNKVSLYDA